MEIWDLGSRFGLWHSFAKGKGSLRERERQSRDLKKFYYVFFFFFNITLTWKSVGASKASILYVYIDNDNVANRIGLYKRYSDILGVGYGNNLDCYNPRSFAEIALVQSKKMASQVQ